MQLESGGTLFLLYATLHWLQASAAVPYLWRQQGIDFDVGPKNLGERGVDDRLIEQQSRSDDDQKRLAEEAYRWLEELDKRKSGISEKFDRMQREVRSEGEEIDQLSQEVEQNAKQIHQLQLAICSLLESMCEKKRKPCEPCPWAPTKEPSQTTLSEIINITTPLPPITDKPSPNPMGSCGEPDAPDNGYVEKNGTTFNTLIILHCNAGFDLMGDSRMICTAIWNEIDHEYQYSWAPPMSAICKANGKPTPPKTTKAPSSKPLPQAPAPANVTKSPTKREYKLDNWSFRQAELEKSRRENFPYDSIDRRGFPSGCFQPMKVGVCKASIPRYFYDRRTGNCKRFVFGGCRGNDNNFVTEEECLCQCKKCP